MKGIFKIILIFATFLASCSRNDAPKIADKEQISTLPIIFEAPVFSAENYDGTIISKETVAGKIWVASFTFTSCSGPCPIINAQLSVLQSEFKDNSDVNFVSFTVDPKNDTKEVLAKYAVRYGAKLKKWYFVRMDENSVKNLIVNGFKLPMGEETSEHSTHVALVDKKGNIRGYYEGTDKDAIGKLQQAMQDLLREKP